MRLLEKSERVFCNELAAHTQRTVYFGDLVNERLKEVGLKVDVEQKKVSLLLPEIDKNELDELRIHSIEQLLIMVSVLELLEKNGYVLLFRISSRTQEQYQFGPSEFSNSAFLEVPIIDERTILLLCKYSRKDIILTEEFRRFCKSGFIARDEQRFQRQLSFTISALAVSTALLVLNMAFTFWPKMSGESRRNLIKLDSMITDIHAIKASMNKEKVADSSKIK